MKKYVYNEEVLLNENAVSFYLLGCYIADGCVYNNTFEITGKDKDWIEIIKNNICPNKILEKQKNCYRFRGTNYKIIEWFKKYKCIPNKSLIVEFPDIPDLYMADFVRGLIDGDGSVSCNRNTIYLVTASKNFADGFMNTLSARNINFSLYERKGKHTIINNVVTTRKNQLYKISIWGKNCYKFLKWIYYNENILCMPRKQILSQKIIDIFEYRGLNLKNIDTFNSDKNRNSNKFTLTNKDIINILTKWFVSYKDKHNIYGIKKTFYELEIKNNYKCCYLYICRLLNGSHRTEIFNQIKNLNLFL